VGACRSGHRCRPLLILAVGFREGAHFEGRIAEQIDQLKQAGTIRVLDFVFLHRDEATGALVRMDYDGPDRDGRVTMLLEGRAGNGHDGPADLADAFRLTAEDIGGGQGRSNAAIAESLMLTKGAVETHIDSMFGKLGLAGAHDVSRRVQATLMFLDDPG